MKHIYENELVKVCFTHNAAYPDSEDLDRLISAKILTDRAYEIAINSKYVGCQRELANMTHIFWQENRIRSKCKLRATQTSY